MTPRSLFSIIIKIIGIYLVLSAFVLIPQLVASLFSVGRQSGINDSGDFLTLGFFLVFAVGFFAMILRYCIFKTDWLIDKLQLDKGFEEEKFELNIHRSTVLRIAVIVIGAVMIVDYLPSFCKTIFSYVQMGNVARGFKDNPNSGWIIVDIVRLFIGFFMITSSRLIVNFIELRRKKPAQAEEI
jgi:hypothetical protein